MTNCANCNRPIGAGEETFEFEGDTMETWCADCGGEEEKRRAEAEQDAALGRLEADHVERVYQGVDMQWHFWLISREELDEIARLAGSTTGMRSATAEMLARIMPNPAGSSIRCDSEGYESEDAAREGLGAIKRQMLKEDHYA